MAINPGMADGRGMQIGRVFARAFATIGANPAVLFGIALVFAGLPGAVIGYFSQRLGAPAQFDEATIGATIAIGVVTFLLWLICYMLAQAAIVRATVAHTEGRRASFGECAQSGLRAVLPLIGLSIVVGVALVIGFVLLIVPAIILYVVWSVATPALVEERHGIFAALSRSRELTKGARWPVFGLQVIVVVIYWLFSSLMGVMLIAVYGIQGMTAVAAGLPIWYQILSIAIQTVAVAVWGAIQTSLYVELRDWKDGPAARNLGEIFA